MIYRKNSNIWKLNDTLLNNPCFKKQVANNLESISNLSGSADTSYPNVWGAAKAVARGRAIAIHACVRKEERAEVSALIRVILKSHKRK